MKMNRFRTRYISAVIIVFMSAMPILAEYVFLKDGSIIKGKVINESAIGIALQNEQNKVTNYPYTNIMRVLYTELNMSKIYVQMKTGKNFRGYMVDEDQNSYTFRNNINKPEEFIIKRADVLFMAERNPSGLNGESGFFEIALNWFPPYDKMKYFNIYLKKDKEVKFKKVDTSRSNSYKLKSLNSNTKYSIKVTGVDETGTETLPSNEITVSTMNRAPFMPPELKVTHQKTGGSIVEWKPAVDPDGTIIKYKIYTLKKNKKEPAGETKDTSYKITGTAAIDRIMVSAIDDMGAESETAAKRMNQADIFRIFISPAVMFPIDTFAAMGSFGFGGTVSFMAQNLFVNGFTLGLEFGYFYTIGKDSLAIAGQNVHGMNFVTGTLKTGYSFKVTDFFFITPAVSFGAAYIDYSYTSRNQTTLTDTEKASRGFDPTGGLSVSFDFIVSDYFFIGLSGSYGLFFENTRVFQFISCGINLGVRF